MIPSLSLVYVSEVDSRSMYIPVVNQIKFWVNLCIKSLRMHATRNYFWSDVGNCNFLLLNFLRRVGGVTGG